MIITLYGVINFSLSNNVYKQKDGKNLGHQYYKQLCCLFMCLTMASFRVNLSEHFSHLKGFPSEAVCWISCLVSLSRLEKVLSHWLQSNVTYFLAKLICFRLKCFLRQSFLP